MSLAYTPPGVSVEETVTTTVSPILAAPALVCLVGLTQGYQTRTDQFVISGTTPIAIPGLPSGAKINSILAVKDVINPSNGATDGSGYVTPADYTVDTNAGTITRVGSGAIANNTIVNVSYTYTPSDYFNPIRLYDIGSVESRFGSGLNSTGTAINSPVSYAASIAFENGADSVVIQPLFKRSTAGDPNTAAGQPNSSQAASLSTWQDTLYVIRDIEDINIIVPVVGQSQANVGDSTIISIFQAVQDHAYFMQTQDQYIVSIIGEDSSASANSATDTTIKSHAATLQSRYGGSIAEQTVLINTAKFIRALPGYNQNITVGGQYVASALAGMIASAPVSSSITRKVISGFISVADSRSLQEKNLDAAAGIIVVEQKNTAVLVRHAITIDNTSSARRELSVVRAKHRMIESVRDTIDRQIVGRIIADGNAEATVSATISAVLEQLRLNRDIVEYSAVEARIISLDPTTMQVRFSYRPAFPINNVAVQFSIDLSSGSISATDNTLTGV